MAIDVLRGVGLREEFSKLLPNISLLGSLPGLNSSVDTTEALILPLTVAALPIRSAQHGAEVQKACKLFLVQGWPCLCWQ